MLGDNIFNTVDNSMSELWNVQMLLILPTIAIANMHVSLFYIWSVK